MERVCVLCGKQFNTSSSRRLRCYDRHIRRCVVCGKEFELKSSSDAINPITCSESCRKVQISRTCSQRDPMFECTCRICGKTFLSHSKISDVCYDQHEATCENCGKVFYSSRQYFLHRRKTCSEKCRYELSNESFMENFGIHKAKSDQTMLELYGDTSPARIPQFIEKRYATNESRYGAKHFAQSAYFKERCIQTNRARYNTDWYQQTDEFKERSKLTLLLKHNVDNYFKSKEFMLNSVSDPSCIDSLFEFKEDPEKFINSRFHNKPTLTELSKVLGIIDSSVGYLMRQMGCANLAKHSYSKMEEEVVEFLKHYLSESEIVQNTKAVITPLEIDIYIPEFNFGIECNPAWTHNSTIGCFNSDPIDSGYHKRKSDLARDKGIFIFHLFGYEWKQQRSKCESLLKEFIKHPDAVLNAEELSVSIVPVQDAVEFLKYNSLLNLSFDCAIGLYGVSTLEAIMTFQDVDGRWFLREYCSKIDTYVHDGASCLLSNFVIEYEPEEIFFYSDRSTTPDEFCKSLGFILVTDTEPNSILIDLNKEIPVDNPTDSDSSNRVCGQVFDAGRTLWIKQKEVMPYDF